MSSERLNAPTSDEIDVAQTFRNVKRRLPILVLCIAVGTVIGVGYTYVVRPRWQARATIYFPSKPPSLLGIGGIGESSAASSAAALLGGTATPIKIFRGFLESERTLDVVCAGTGLSRRDVEDMRSFDEQTGSSTLTVFAGDRDADLAKKVVKLHIKALKDINVDLSIGSLEDDVRVLKAMLAKEKAKLSTAQDRLTLFKLKAVTAPTAITIGGQQGTTGIAAGTSWAQQLKQLEVKLDGVNAALSKQRLSAELSLKMSPLLPSDLPPAKLYRGQLVEAQYDLALKEKTLGPDDPTVIDLKNRINLLQAKLKKEMAAYVKSMSNDTVEPGSHTLPTDTGTEIANIAMKVGLEAQIEALKQLAALAPKETDTLTRLTLDQTIETASVEQLEAQTKIAEIQAERDPNRWTLLDPPRIDEKPINKKFPRNGGLGAVVGLIAGLWLSSRAKGSQA